MISTKYVLLINMCLVGVMQLYPITEVEKNILKLKETGECKGCILTGAQLKGAELRDVHLEKANLAELIL